MRFILTAVVSVFIFSACKFHHKEYDKIIRNGMIYDGNGGEPYKADIGIRGDSIAFIGDLSGVSAQISVDAKGMAVAPGFINMLSWANESLIQDGRSMSDIRQGVTLEVMGEGESMGPLNAKMKDELQKGQVDIKYKVDWNTLGEYLDWLTQKGISCNVASFVGATTVRVYVVGEDNRDPTPAEMDSMKALVKQAMEEGAMGVGTSLIYPPAFFAKTNELVELSKVASQYGGSYISHMRNEGNKLFEAFDELATIAREAKIHAEIYHLKAAGKDNWWKIDSLVKIVDKARSAGLDISADMYTYHASATGLTAAFPPSLQDGG
ncbi:MAG TPA: hypothetical protein VLJ68_10700, partial [Chitinophagaceae bacterium]|nr:hypothetical protein [Chitinophagaceae bacterium]